MKRALAMLVLVAGLLFAACAGPGGSPATSIEPFSPDVSPSLDSSPTFESAEPSENMEMSPEASPS